MEITAHKADRNRMPAKVDFTAMVDLAFLLITFFMLTTSLAKPNILPLVMPQQEGIDNPPDIGESKVLTLLLAANDQIYYYEGLNNAQLNRADFSNTGIRRVILDKKDQVDAQFGLEIKKDAHHPGQNRAVSHMTVLIKPLKESRYKNMVDVFDEMKICGIGHYMMLEPTPEESASVFAQ